MSVFSINNPNFNHKKKRRLSLFLKGNREKGWNDPPEFLHNTTEGAASTPPKKTILNQRVAHNFDGKVDLPPKDATTDSCSQETKLVEPPKMTLPPAGPALVSNSIKTDQATSSQIELMTIDEIRAILQKKIEILKENNVSALIYLLIYDLTIICLILDFKCKTCDEILKRIDIFAASWPKLNQKVKERMNNLVKGTCVYLWLAA